MAHSSNGATRTIGALLASSTALLVVLGCGAPAPTANAPTTTQQAPPAAPAASPPAQPSASPAAKPSQAPSPAAASTVPSPASVAASAVASPSSPVAASAADQAAAVNAPLVLSGPLTDGFVLTSSAFTDGGTLPTDYSCDQTAGGISPPLSWSGAPSSTQAFALVDQDPDAGANGNAFTHWVIYNIPASASQLQAGLPPGAVVSPLGALQGQNGRSIVGYQGACPPPGSPPHHYTFQLFALKAPLALSIGASIGELQRAMSGNVLGQTKLVALFAH